jgi:hypothetical protein
LVASALGLSLTDVSCGGAKTENLEKEQVLSVPPNNPPQFNALSASTEVASLGMGGNDFNVFGTLVFGCTQIDSAWLAAYGNVGAPCKEHLEGFIQNAFKEDVAPFNAALAKIRALSPDAKVFVVGYPEITPANGFCPAAIPWTTGDLTWFREIEQQGNALKRSGALANHDVFVDTFPLSVGHNACEPVGKRWVEPLYGSLEVPLHPNATGEQADAVDLGVAMVLNGVF